jgi:hypothetical protein
MKLLFENWRKFLQEKDTRAFHGYGMNPVKMRIQSCSDQKEPDNQWESGETGCPKFTDDKGVGADHEDLIEAIEFIDTIQPSNLIAYSRGGAVASYALNKTKHKPEVTFIAPAWKRGWVSGNPLPPSGLKGAIIHGGADDKVPLKHSFILAKETGLSLYVFPYSNHINILKNKLQPTSGVLVKNFKIGNDLPEWGEGEEATKEQVEAQNNFAAKLKKGKRKK